LTKARPPEKDYSGTPLYKKLGIKEGSRVLIADGPVGFETTLGPLPPGAAITKQARGPLDVVVVFATKAADLERRFNELKKRLDPAGGLWVAHPKKTSGIATDLDFTRAQQIGLDAGLVDNKSCAIDDDWSGLRFVYRLKDR
jgi:hypothetical protein